MKTIEIKNRFDGLIIKTIEVEDGADLRRADLRHADLSDADLSGANLRWADLENVRNMPCFQIVPEIGPFYAFKKLKEDFFGGSDIVFHTAEMIRPSKSKEKRFQKLIKNL